MFADIEECYYFKHRRGLVLTQIRVQIAFELIYDLNNANDVRRMNNGVFNAMTDEEY
ncbi:hypothetical protein T10_10585 [Trichinella papuae]|uniref:Uncharacterized protein n=1 Tax=Trichinella papuae TaxID=268474 RepID=A0A0V1M0H1_9BILA|nr:hypothetical protein T10_10585 [Trichinella papuae]